LYISKEDISSSFKDYINDLKKVDIELGSDIFNHIMSSKRCASETQLYNNYYQIRFQKVIINYLSEIIGNSDVSIPLVDFGGGTGVLSIFLATLGYQVTIWDVDRLSLDICEKRARKFNVNINIIESTPNLDRYNLLSFFSIREASLNGASISIASKNAIQIFMIDRNEKYLLFKIFNRKYGLTISEIDKVFLESGLALSKRYGTCLMPKEFSYFEPNNIIAYPLFMSSMYFSSYSRIN